MATISHTTVSKPGESGMAGCAIYKWEELDATDTVGDAVEIPAYADRTVQVVGTFDTGTLTMQGSLDGSTWFTLTDYLGNNVAFTAVGGKGIAEIVRYIRPSLSGAGSDDVDIYLLCRGLPI